MSRRALLLAKYGESKQKKKRKKLNETKVVLFEETFSGRKAHDHFRKSSLSKSDEAKHPEFLQENTFQTLPDENIDKLLSQRLKDDFKTGKIDRERDEKQRTELLTTKGSNFYSSDDKLETSLKNKIRKEDPLAYMYAKKSELIPHEKPDKRTYAGPTAPTNRFGIKPGYRWDGVDRSNGYEKQYLNKLNTKAVR